MRARLTSATSHDTNEPTRKYSVTASMPTPSTLVRSSRLACNSGKRINPFAAMTSPAAVS